MISVRLFAKRGLLALLLALFPLVLTAQQQTSGGVHCPPQPGDNAQNAGDIDGDGKDDWVFPDLSQKDDAGNTVEVYCLSASGQHGAQFESYYIDKATGQKYLIGGCYFPNGQNTRSKEKFTEGPNKGNWKLLDWDNVDPDSTNDWHFEFDPATKKMTKTKTTHKVSVETRDNIWYANTRSTVVGVEVQDGVSSPWDVTFGGEPLMRSCEKNDCGGISVANLAVSSSLVRLGQWQISFTVPAFGGSGTQDDPIAGSPAQISAGDKLKISGASITRAFVRGAAADPANGGWRVESSTPSEVTFVATFDAEVWPGRPVQGLFIESSYTGIGRVPWSAFGDDIRYDGFIDGPGPVAAAPAEK